ncbi:oligosaccharide flippase family protein [Yinghuangia seranimata]|uniref:oligosaccharide flippase family protein n=1 Tax=Yinghuangia seranimata TaxID=408067 RepID=UPI00248C9B4E|nr:oligosaccharide flippase family protein [Yinghuangia seranimata]MDI2128398.1 oligosaccharide flippase family protein [Yinghuangia seranimata]
MTTSTRPDPGERAPSEARTAVRSLAWNYGSAVAGALLQLCYTAFTARVVYPDAYGAFAAASAALTIPGYVAGAGLATYLLRIESLTRATVRTAYRVAFAGGALCCLGSLLLAAPLAQLWGMPEIDPIVRLFGLFFLTQPASLVASAALQRLNHARFCAVTESYAQLLGMASGGVLLALGWSPYGLVAAQVITPAVTLAAASVRLRRCPLPEGTAVRPRAMLAVSGAFACFGMVQVVGADVVLWAVTRHGGAHAAGQFSRAVLTVGLPLALLAQSLRRATMPSMARINAEGRSLAGAVPDVLTVASAAACVSFGVLAAVGPAVTELLLGPGWGPAAALVPVFALGAPLVLLCQIGYAVDETHKHLRVLLRVQLLVLGATAATTALWVLGPDRLALLAVVASLAHGVGHAVQVARWRRLGLCSPRDLAKPYAVHTAVGAALFAAGWAGAGFGDGAVSRIVCGLLAMLPVLALCWPLRRQLPLYAVAVTRGLLGDPLRPTGATGGAGWRGRAPSRRTAA